MRLSSGLNARAYMSVKVVSKDDDIGVINQDRYDSYNEGSAMMYNPTIL